MSLLGRQDLGRPILMKFVHDPIDLPSTCTPSLTTLAFRLREVRRLLLDLDSYGGTDPLSVFPFFLKRTADVMAPRLAVVFRRLIII